MTSGVLPRLNHFFIRHFSRSRFSPPSLFILPALAHCLFLSHGVANSNLIPWRFILCYRIIQQHTATIMSQTWTCTNCGRSKPIELFQRHPKERINQIIVAKQWEPCRVSLLIVICFSYSLQSRSGEIDDDRQLSLPYIPSQLSLPLRRFPTSPLSPLLQQSLLSPSSLPSLLFLLFLQLEGSVKLSAILGGDFA